MHCPACGTENPQDAKYCSHCRTPLPTEEPAKPEQPPAQPPPAETTSPAATTSPPKISHFALVSLILAVIGASYAVAVGAFDLRIGGCIFLLCPGLFGIILGWIGLAEIKRRPHRLKGRQLAVAGIVLSVLWMIVLALAPAMNNGCVYPSHIACLTNLRQLHMACIFYQDDNNQQFPPDLKTLRDSEYEYVSDNDLICPARRNTPDQIPYVYCGAGLVGEIPDQLIIIYEPFANHDGDARNVLFGDGHVERVKEDKFLSLIWQDLQLRREKGLPELPFE